MFDRLNSFLCSVPGSLLQVVFFAFWLWMLIDCLMNQPSSPEKIVWVLVIILLPCLGALLYFFLKKPKRPL
ncbi:MAG: PLDc_N domain-containing protein [Pirellulales bacterium]|nr:PLDc_N domain-containing protein [Pirellulales bacterium]